MKNFLFILSPSLALYNHYKNLIHEITRGGDNVDIFLPKPVTYVNIINELNIISEKLNIKEFIVLVNPLNPYSKKKLQIADIKKLTQKNSFKVQVFLRLFISRLITKFQIKKISPFLGNSIRYISSRKIVMHLIGNNLFKIRYQSIFYDLFEEKKFYLFPYLSYFYSVKRFSLFHGSGISSTHFFEKPFWSYLNKLLILDYTGLNKSQYIYNLSTNKFDYKVIGIPNHYYEREELIYSQSKEINFLKSELDLEKETIFMTLTSRPDDNTFCNSNDRKSYLKTIGNYLSEHRHWHLLIKAHPKEKEYNKEMWAESLGLSVDQNNFSISKKSPLELALISKIGFSFVSTCCIDFASLGTPMIELTSLNKTKFIYKTNLFSHDGFPLTAEAFHKLTINVKNNDELNIILDNIEDKISKYSETVKVAYQNCFGYNPYSPGIFRNLVRK